MLPLNLLATGPSTLVTTCLINKLSQSPRKYNTHTISLASLASSNAADALFDETRFDAIYLALPADHCTEAVKAFLDAAKGHRVPFVVFVGVLGAEDLPADLAGRYLDIEAYLAKIRIPHTVLRVAPLQQDFMFLSSDFDQRIPTIELPFSNGSVAPIHARDVANVAAAILDNPTAHISKTYTLTGPDLLTGVELAGRAAVGLDRPVGFRNCQPAKARNHLLARSKKSNKQPAALLDNDAVEAALRMFDQVASHGCEQVTTTVHALTHAPATHIEDFFKEHRKLFNARAPSSSTTNASSAQSRATATADDGLEFVANAYVGSDGNGLGRYMIRSKL
ncbi:hypothetical protein HDU87_001281 [Geranomyces variabilis]|uniref:NmrA-like domain-containing protein n=1 Tax=Geranomyces variabilis TaxID=109894 RepID=A0AAD5XJ21_9FUNG|nr:hypothetical protein HDU87_001281 [Geranomyces variabilis]